MTKYFFPLVLSIQKHTFVVKKISVYINMKKINFWASVFMIIGMLCACNKENEKAEEFNIVGSAWEIASYAWDEKDPNSAMINLILEFVSPTEVVFNYKVIKGEVPEEIHAKEWNHKLSYTYSGSILKIISSAARTVSVYEIDEERKTMRLIAEEILDEKGNVIESKKVGGDILHRIK